MYDLIEKIKNENPEFIEKSFRIFAKKMPKLLLVMYYGEEYDNHIGTKEVAILAENFITNNKGEKIGFHWDYDTLINAAKNYVDFDKVDFYKPDLWVWANVKYGDMQHITNDSSTIIKYAISELTDEDFPFYPASQRAYCWLKKHIEKEVE